MYGLKFLITGFFLWAFFYNASFIVYCLKHEKFYNAGSSIALCIVSTVLSVLYVIAE